MPRKKKATELTTDEALRRATLGQPVGRRGQHLRSGHDADIPKFVVFRVVKTNSLAVSKSRENVGRWFHAVLKGNQSRVRGGAC